MNKCPKCGGVSGFVTHDYFAGWAECISTWQGDGDYPAFSDKVIIRRLSKTVICIDCGIRVMRPEE